MRTRLPLIGPSQGLDKSATASGVAVLGIGVMVPGDLLSGDGVEETVTVVRDDHHQIVAAARMRCEADAEEPTDRDERNGPPGFGRRHHRGGEEPTPHRALVCGEFRLPLQLLDRTRLLRPLHHDLMIHASPGSPNGVVGSRRKRRSKIGGFLT